MSSAPSAGPSVHRLSIRVALAASAIVGVAYLVIAAAVAIVITNNLTSEVDGHLQQALVQMSDVGQGPGGGPPDQKGFDPTRQDPRALPVLVWHVAADGSIAPQGLTNLDLPSTERNAGPPTSVSIDGATYRLAGAPAATGRVVVGQSMDNVSATQSTLIVAEVGIGCALLIVVFLGAVAIGRRVALPIERERERQLEFTADASHELRTPLSVIKPRPRSLSPGTVIRLGTSPRSDVSTRSSSGPAAWSTACCGLPGSIRPVRSAASRRPSRSIWPCWPPKPPIVSRQLPRQDARRWKSAWEPPRTGPSSPFLLSGWIGCSASCSTTPASTRLRVAA